MCIIIHSHIRTDTSTHTHTHTHSQSLSHRVRVANVVALGLERAHEIASYFYEAAQALSFSLPRLLKVLEPMDTPLSDYAEHISKLRAAAQAAMAAAPSEVCCVLCLFTSLSYCAMLFVLLVCVHAFVLCFSHRLMTDWLKLCVSTLYFRCGPASS